MQKPAMEQPGPETNKAPPWSGLSEARSTATAQLKFIWPLLTVPPATLSDPPLMKHSLRNPCPNVSIYASPPCAHLATPVIVVVPQIASAWPVIQNLAAVTARAMRSLRTPTSSASSADDPSPCECVSGPVIPRRLALEVLSLQPSSSLWRLRRFPGTDAP